MKAARPQSRQASSRLHSRHSLKLMGGGGGGWSDQGVGIFFGGGKKKTAEQPVQWRVDRAVGDLLTNSKGGRFLPLRNADGAPPSWQSPEWLKIIWHPAAYGDQEARRVNVCFEPDATAADFFTGLERELVDRLAAKSAHEPKIFNKALARPEIEARMQSCLKTSQRGSSFLKAKLNWDRVRLPQDDDEARVRHELREIPVPGDWDQSLEPTTSCPAPPPEIRRELYRVHRNLGHPDNSTFARALKHSGRTDMLSRAAKLAGNVFPLPHIERVEALIRPSTVKSCANFGCTLQQGDCSLAVHVCCLSDVTCALADAVAAACAATLAVLIPGRHAGIIDKQYQG